MIVGHRADGGLNVQLEVVLEQPAQLTGHLESQGIHPDVGDLAFVQLWLHLLLENIPLPQHPFDRMLGLLELGDEVLGQFRADFGVALLGLGDELFQPVMVCAELGSKVVLAALHVPVVRVEQAPRLSSSAYALTRAGTVVGAFLIAFAHPVGFEQDLGGSGNQRPPAWIAGITSAQKRDSRDSASSSSGVVSGLQQVAFDMRSSARSTHRKVSFSLSVLRVKLKLTRGQTPVRPCWPRPRSCPARPGCVAMFGPSRTQASMRTRCPRRL